VFDALYFGGCGTDKRPCPKILSEPERAVRLSSGTTVPPPCLYLFPRTIPDYRNNPFPKAWALKDIAFLETFRRTFNVREAEVTEVRFEAGHNGSDITRVTHLFRNNSEFARSKADVIRRARG
jgi:hypothetical protein